MTDTAVFPAPVPRTAERGPRPTFASLFSGIGGIDRGLELAGWECRWQSEIDPYASKVLEKHWPDVPNLGDVTTIDWSTVEPVDLVCGGYPCQPFSLAGKRAGEADDRYLWPYFADALRLLRPEWALLENVPGHLGLGFDRVLADLASLGFDAEWELLPAAAFGAPHLRYRLYVVAHAVSDQLRDQPVTEFWSGGASVFRGNGTAQPVANTDSQRCQEQWRSQPAGEEWETSERRGEDVADPEDPNWRGADDENDSWRRYPQTGGCRLGGTGLQHWSVEPDVGRVANGVPNRVDRLRGLGNAVVPQAAEWIGRQILTAMQVAA